MIFKQIDSNNDGIITFPELREVRRITKGMIPSPLDHLRQTLSHRAPSTVLTLSDVGHGSQNRRIVDKHLPELIGKWEEIDSNNDGEVKLEEMLSFFGPTGTWLDYQLSRVIGLEKLKHQVRKFYLSVCADQRRAEAGHTVKQQSKYHMIFQGLISDPNLAAEPHWTFLGNPGTGKTTLGRMVANLLHKLGIIPEPLLKEAAPRPLASPT